MQIDNSKETTKLWIAAYQNDYNTVQQLINQDEVSESEVNTPFGIWRNTCLHLAVKNRSLKIVRSLIFAKANVNAININGTTPLHMAVLNEDSMMIQELIEAGANPKKKNYNEKSPEQLASTSCPKISRLFQNTVLVLK